MPVNWEGRITLIWCRYRSSVNAGELLICGQITGSAHCHGVHSFGAILDVVLASIDAVYLPCLTDFKRKALRSSASSKRRRWSSVAIHKGGTGTGLPWAPTATMLK